MNKVLHLNQETLISYSDIGAGPPLLFVHGLGSNKKAFEKNIRELSKYHRCIALDLPGYGESSKTDAEVSLTSFANAINSFVRGLGIGKIVIAGHSMGAQIAVIATLREPELIERLILIAPAGIEVFNDFQKTWIESVSSPELYASLSDEQVIQNFKANFYSFPEDARFMIKDRFEIQKNQRDYRFYCELLHSGTVAMLDAPVFSRLHEIKQECLIIFGKNDQLIPNQFCHPEESPESIARKAVLQIPNSSFQMIAHAGHFVMWEQADQFNRITAEFLKHADSPG